MSSDERSSPGPNSRERSSAAQLASVIQQMGRAGHAPQPPSRHPAAESEGDEGSQPLQVVAPPKFGEDGEFWRHYNKLAEKQEQDMVGTLNTNLDILLIFVCLFLRHISETIPDGITKGWSILSRQHGVYRHFAAEARSASGSADGSPPLLARVGPNGLERG